jgi:23S rRNA G2445 N2-methylase RlmL
LTELAPAIPELAPEDAVFRVRCTRVGVHPFTSEDVEREAGAGVRAWATRGVRLKGPAVVVRCDVRDRDVLVGVELEGIRRPPPPYRPTTSLKPTLAWGLLALAGRPARELLDPFAGGGTVLLEAAATWPGARLHASDLHDRNVDGLRLNLPRAEVRSGDARRLDEVWADRRFDTVVTNPPFGRRLARDVDLEGLYRGFLRSAALVTTDDARVVVLAQKRGAFNRALRAVGAWETRHVRIVEVGGLYAGAFVLQRG